MTRKPILPVPVVINDVAKCNANSFSCAVKSAILQQQQFLVK